MRVQTVLLKVGDFFKYLWTWRRRRLHQQWVDRAGLSPDAIPAEEVVEDITPEIDTKQLRLLILYILLGFSLGILGTGLILLMVQSC